MYFIFLCRYRLKCILYLHIYNAEFHLILFVVVAIAVHLLFDLCLVIFSWSSVRP